MFFLILHFNLKVGKTSCHNKTANWRVFITTSV